MCDMLSELSQLSLELQDREVTLILADKKLKRTIRVIDSFKTTDGDFSTEVVNTKTKCFLRV